MKHADPQRRASLAILVAILVVVVMLGSGLTRVYKQPSIEALVPVGSDSLRLRNQVREIFGLKDPIIVALVTERPGGLLDPAALNAVHDITAALREVPQIDPEQVFSIATEQWVQAEGDELLVHPLLPPRPLPVNVDARLRQALDQAPMYRGTLVAKDLSAALVAAELRSTAVAADAYEAVLDRLKPIVLPAGVSLQVAGEATTVGFLSRFIDRDARVLTPAAAVLMLVFLAIFLHGWRGLAAGALVMAGTLLSTVGLMGWTGSPIYVITSCMPAILLCVSIADASHYGARVARLRAGGMEASQSITEAMRELWRPILLTSFTNAAGFAAMALTASLPPLVDYGAFAAFGVAVAWVITAFGVPALFHLVGTPQRRGTPAALLSLRQKLGQLSEVIADHPSRVLTLTAGFVALGISYAATVEYNEERIRNFGSQSPVYQADQLINTRFAGTSALDVYLHADQGQSMLDPQNLARIRSLQAWMEREGGIRETHSFVDLIAMAIAATDKGSTRLPESAAEAEQWLFLFEASGEPGALRQEITADRTQAYVRGYVDSGNYQLNHVRVEALREQLHSLFSGTGIRADLTGSVALTDSWVGPYLPSTMTGILASALLVALMCGLMLRSWLDGLLCLLPVGSAVLCVFGLMGALGIWLNVATSMFASIGIGLGVDFAIHTLHAIRRGQELGHSGAALTRFVHQDVGAPLTANMLILVLGFSVTMLSVIPPLRSFGLLVSATVVGSYLAAVLILPSIYSLATSRRPVMVPA